MKINRAAWFFIIIAMFLVLGGSTPPKADPIKWFSYEDGMAAGKKTGKKIYLHFYADWCGYCRVMNSKTFVNPEVVEYLNENYISIKVNTDKSRKVASKYMVQGLPSNWFMTPAGKGISTLPGYIDPAQMIKILKFINTESYKKMPYSQFEKTL